MLLERRLTMLCEIVPVLGQGPDGDPIYGGSISDVKCYCYGNTRRFRNEKGQEYVPEFRLIVFPNTDIDNNYKVLNVKDQWGNSVAEDTYVTNVNFFDHPRNGRVLNEVYLAKR